MNLLFWYRSLMQSVGATLVKLIATATSGIVSFTTNVIRPVKVTCKFSPVQEGTGDPSPDNVRPISGWTGCEITRTGKNLYDKNTTTITTKRTVNYTTGELNGLSNSRMGYTSYVPIQENTWYSISGIGPGAATNAGHAFYDKDKVYISGVSKGGSATSFETPAGAAFARFSVIAVTGTSAATLADEIQLELGQTATDFEAYNANALSVDWTDDAGTLYGGTLTINEDGSADLVKTHGYVLFDGSSDESISKYGSGSASAFAMSLGLTRNARGNLTSSNLGNIRSNYLKTLTTNATWGNYNAFVSVTASASRPTIECGIKTITTVADFRAYLAENPLQIAYLLYTPQTYHFDNIGQLNSFLGENNIWHDMNGSITAEYYKKQ